MSLRATPRVVRHANTTKPKKVSLTEPHEPAPAKSTVNYPSIPGVKSHLIRWLEDKDLDCYIVHPEDPPVIVPDPITNDHMVTENVSQRDEVKPMHASKEHRNDGTSIVREKRSHEHSKERKHKGEAIGTTISNMRYPGLSSAGES
jgi:hypothetical protein